MMIYIRNIFTGLSIFALTLFIGNGFWVGQVHAQTTDKAINTKGTGAVARSEFKHDVDQGAQEVKNDKEAKSNQLEIDNEDNEQAGDSHGDAKEIDGENDQSEIDNEIEVEVEQENETEGSAQQDSVETMNNGTSTSTNGQGN